MTSPSEQTGKEHSIHRDMQPKNINSKNRSKETCYDNEILPDRQETTD